MAERSNGKQLAAATADAVINLWCLLTYQPLVALQGHGDTVWGVESPPFFLSLLLRSDEQRILDPLGICCGMNVTISTVEDAYKMQQTLVKFFLLSSPGDDIIGYKNGLTSTEATI